jgi:hypothetical protein
LGIKAKAGKWIADTQTIASPVRYRSSRYSNLMLLLQLQIILKLTQPKLGMFFVLPVAKVSNMYFYKKLRIKFLCINLK